MRRFLLGLSCVVAVSAVGVASAEAATYKGGIKGEPDTSLKIQVKKFQGDRFVTRITFGDLPVHCESGNTETSGSGVTDGDGLEVKKKKFEGGWEFGKVKGKFKGSGKLTGRISIAVDAGQPFGDCESGNLDYVTEE